MKPSSAPTYEGWRRLRAPAPACSHAARLGTLLALALLLGCSGLALGTANGLARLGRYRVETDLAYGAEPSQRLDVYRPIAEEPAPVVIFFHGGRWTTGSRSEYTFVGQALTSRGFVAIIPDYRKFPDVRFPEFVDDGAAVVAWARERVQEFGGDRDQLFVMGHSSGAHMAALLALDARYLGRRGGEPAWLRGMVGLAGPYDFDARRPDLREIFADTEDVAQTQPVHFAQGASVPMLLLHGEDDDVVKPRNATSLARAVRSAGGQADVRLFVGCGHTDILAALSIPLRGRWPVLDVVSGFVRRSAGGASTQARSRAQ